MRLIATLTTAVALLAPMPSKAGAHEPCKTRKCKARVAHRQCDQQHPRTCILHVVYHQRLRGWRRAWLLRVPSCESGWNPLAYFAHPQNRERSAALTRLVYRLDISSGLYAFKPSTWGTTPYAGRSIWSAFWQPYAAAWMLEQGRVGEWACR